MYFNLVMLSNSLSFLLLGYPCVEITLWGLWSLKGVFYKISKFKIKSIQTSLLASRHTQFARSLFWAKARNLKSISLQYATLFKKVCHHVTIFEILLLTRQGRPVKIWQMGWGLAAFLLRGGWGWSLWIVFVLKCI